LDKKNAEVSTGQKARTTQSFTLMTSPPFNKALQHTHQ